MGKVTLDAIAKGVECLQGMIDLMEGKVMTTFRLAVDEAFRRSIAEECIKEVRESDGDDG